MKFEHLFDNYFPKWEVINQIPEFAALESTPQNELWHREGDALIHTANVCHHMHLLVFHLPTEENQRKLILMAAALCHDLGKPSTTYVGEDGLCHCKNHGAVGEQIVRTLFAEDELCEQVATLVRHHMALHYITPSNSNKTFDKLSKYGDIDDFLKLYESDIVGSLNDYDNKELIKNVNDLHKQYLLGMRTIVICRGIPASGKTTFAKAWVTEDPENRVRINLDDIRNMVGPYWVPSREQFTGQLFEKILEIACIEGKNIVVDNMNLNERALDQIVHVLSKQSKFLYNYEYKNFFDVPLETCIERDKQRPNPIGEDVITRIYNQYKSLLNG